MDRIIMHVNIVVCYIAFIDLYLCYIKPLGYLEDKTEDDWGKKIVPDKEYKKKFPLYIPPTYRK